MSQLDSPEPKTDKAVAHEFIHTREGAQACSQMRCTARAARRYDGDSTRCVEDLDWFCPAHWPGQAALEEWHLAHPERPLTLALPAG